MDDFFDFYFLEKKVVIPENTGYNKVNNGQRTCRFCRGTEGLNGITFYKKAHTISKALGNMHLLSNDECDECNRKFSVYENSLTRYVEMRRALYEGGKKFTLSADSPFSIKPCAQIKGAVKISDNTQDLTHTSTLEDGSILITATTHPYIPIMVYRTLLKYALAIIDEKYLDDYQDTYGLLIDNELNNSLRILAKVCQDTLNNIQVKTHCCVYKRKDNIQGIPNHMVVFGYHNVTLQLFLPYSKQDQNLYNGHFTPRLFSPDFFAERSKKVSYQRKTVDLSGIEKTAHTEKFLMNFDENLYNQKAEKSPFKKISDQELFSDIVYSQIILAPSKSD